MADYKSVFERLDQYKSIIDSPPSYTPDNNDIDDNDLSTQDKLIRTLQNKRYESDTQDRKWLAEWATTAVSIWLLFVLLILIANHGNIHLSDTVLSMLLGTTTLNVLGLSFIVLRGHFNSAK